MPCPYSGKECHGGTGAPSFDPFIMGRCTKAVEYGLVHRPTDKVLYIGIDELARRRGHVYQTN
ncbi:MAG: hypothetical protein ABIF71_01960, partial [Planctomycetota bacterium]